MKSWRQFLSFLFVIPCLFTNVLFAASATWNNAGVDTVWTTLNNWVGPPADVPGTNAAETATFDSTVVSTVTSAAIANPVTVAISGAGGYVFAGGAATIAGTNINITSTGTNTIQGGFFNAGALSQTSTGTTTFSADNGGANTLTSITLNNATGTINFNGNTTSPTNTLTTGTMQGSGTLTGPLTMAAGSLGGAVTVTGTLALNGGTVLGTATIGGLVTQAAGTIRGAVTLNGGLTQNGGTISPANTGTTGTINITGNYIQNAGGNYALTVSSIPSSDVLAVTGNVTLNGTVTLDFIPGIYNAGTTYTVITSAGITAFNPTLVETSDLDFNLVQNGNNVQLIILSNAIALPVSISQLPVNSQRVATYLYADSTPAGALRDLVLVTLNSSAGVFADTLLQLSPIAYGAFAQVALRNNVHMADALAQRTLQTLCNSDPDCDTNFKQMWVEPIYFYYHQAQNNRQRGFDNYTYGVAYGMQLPVSNALSLGWATGYSHSGIVWYPVLGNASINSVYLGLDAGLINRTTPFGESSFLNLLVQGDVDFIKSTRKIRIPTFSRDADSDHTSYNILVEMAGGMKFFSQDTKFFIQPEAKLDYLNTFETGYKEIGAGTADLKVNYKHAVFLRPEFKFRLIKEIKGKLSCFTPNVFLGWVGNYQITSGLYTAHMYNIIAAQREFSVTSYDRYTNQITYGAEFSMTRCKSFMFKLGYEGYSLSHINVQVANARIEWAF